MEQIFKQLNENKLNQTAYMIRNDGEVFECNETHPYFYNMEDLNDINASIQKWLNMPSNVQTLDFLEKHSKEAEVVKIIKELKNEKNSTNITYEYVKYLNNVLNQEFLRIRLGGEYFGSNSSLYCRISSHRFNWFDIIWKFVFEHQDQLRDITIEHDSLVFNDDRKYKIGGLEMNHVNINIFLTLKGHPIVEKQFDNEFCNNLKAGKSIWESSKTLPFHRARVIYESLFKDKHLIDFDIENCIFSMRSNKNDIRN